MKQLLLTTVLLLVLTSCSGRKHIESAISHGNYDQAINDALRKLESNKDKKRKQDYINLLKEAYDKVLNEDLQRIDHYKKDGNPEQFKIIYELYTDLNARQNAIKRVLPLRVNGKLIKFKLKDYNTDIVDYRYKTSDYLIEEGISLLDSNNKYDARKAYTIFNYIEKINPNFEETRSLINEAHKKGIDHVLVTLANTSQHIFPQQLEQQLLDFNTYGLNKLWTEYHSNSVESLDYDYAINLNIKQIHISPERINERQLLREKEVVDGWEYQLDTNGNVMKDSLGNDIKIDKIITAKARFYEVMQTKSTQVLADVVFTDLKQNKVLDTFAVDSGFTFEHVFGRFRGDKRALNSEDRNLLNRRREQFPTDVQMLLDSGTDLKLKLKDILHSYKLIG